MSTKDYIENYSSVRGHNVLQCENSVSKSEAPLLIEQLDENCGKITIVCKDAYENITKWDRNISFNQQEIIITDEVILNGTANEVFRFHTGAKTLAEIEKDGNNIYFNDVVMEFSSDCIFDIQLFTAKNAVFDEKEHICVGIYIKSTKFTLRTKIVKNLE